MLTAIAHPLRLQIIAELAGGRVHVSELGRRLGMSRPLLYMHLDRLEKAGLVTGQLELSRPAVFEPARLTVPPMKVQLTGEDQAAAD